jgi:hypothetical protein
VALLLLQQSAGTRVMFRCLVYSLVWGALVGIFTVCLPIGLADGDTKTSAYRGAQVGVESVLFVFYMIIGFVPKRWLFRRPALYLFARYFAFNRLVKLLFQATYLAKDSSAPCLELSHDWIAAAFNLLVLFKTLVADSQHWQGVKPHTKRTISLQAPLSGITIDPKTATHLAKGMDRLDGRVPILNYAHLELGDSKAGKAPKMLGAGGTGKLHSTGPLFQQLTNMFTLWQ